MDEVLSQVQLNQEEFEEIQVCAYKRGIDDRQKDEKFMVRSEIEET